MGQKRTTFFALDLGTGRVAFQYEFSAGTVQQEVSKEVLRAFSGDSRDFILLARTEYGLAAFAPHWSDLKTPAVNITFSHFSGLASPFSPSTRSSVDGGTEKEQDGEQLFYSSLNRIIVARDQHTKEVMWVRKLPSVATLLAKLVEPAERSLGHDQVGPIFVPIPIEASLMNEVQESSISDENPLEQVPVNVGREGGTLFVLPSDRFPLFGRAYSAGASGEEAVVSISDGMMPISNTNAGDPYKATIQECQHGSPGFPECLLGARVAQIVHLRPLLGGNNMKLVRRTTTAADGHLIVLVTLIACLAGGIVLLIAKNRMLAKRVPSVERVDPAGDAPPGFERVSLTTADRIYTTQDGSLDDSSPRSFLVSETIIGYGSHGTVVFKGTFDGREVAVKRLLMDYYRIVGDEVSLLQQSDRHPNVIRYFCHEKAGKFAFIVLELCKCSLADLVEDRKGNANDSRGIYGEEFCAALKAPVDLLRQIVLGLYHLHGMNLVHRDIKPQNILMTMQARPVISDFGLGKQLTENQSSFNPTFQGGTLGWRAPECIMAEEQQKLSSLRVDRKESSPVPPPLLKVSKSIDIFALGCVFYYILSKGEHPFGSKLEREANVVRQRSDISKVTHLPEAWDLIHRMIARAPGARPNCQQVLSHPYFWPAQKQVAFLQDVSDRFEIEDRREFSEILRAFESRKYVIFEGNTAWHRAIDQGIWLDLCTYRKYNGQSARDLLRALRNKRNHFHELSPELRKIIGDTPETFMRYFLKRFPRLLIETYRVVESSGLCGENPFRDSYF